MFCHLSQYLSYTGVNCTDFPLILRWVDAESWNWTYFCNNSFSKWALFVNNTDCKLSENQNHTGNCPTLKEENHRKHNLSAPYQTVWIMKPQVFNFHQAFSGHLLLMKLGLIVKMFHSSLYLGCILHLAALNHTFLFQRLRTRGCLDFQVSWDNDPKHTSGYSKSHLSKTANDEVRHQMTWPLQSPNLTPTEVVWIELDWRLKKKPPTSTPQPETLS